jgi:hypothetical protein
MAGGSAVCEALQFGGDIKVRNLQALHEGII